MALINQLAAQSGKKPIGLQNPSLYAQGKSSGRPAYFHDITEGNSVTMEHPAEPRQTVLRGAWL
jgi:hypothetical protein